MASSENVWFDLNFKDNLSGPLAGVSAKGIASLKGLDSAGSSLTKNLSGGLAGAFSSLVSPIGLATAAVGALALGLKSVISTGTEFQKKMSEVQAILGASADETKRLNDLAISLGASTTFSSSQVANSMAEIARGGFDTKQIEASMSAILDLASATGTDLTRAGEIALSTLNSFGLEASRAAQITDMLTATANRSATGVEDLSEGLNYIAANAHSMGVSLEEVLSIQGALGDAGLRGSVATRALGSALQRLSAPSDKAATMMKNLGLNFFDANGEFVGIIGTVERLETALAGASTEMKAAAIQTIFGSESFGEINILMGKGSANLRTFQDELLNTRGVARETSKIMLDNLAGDVEQLGGAWESMQLKVFGQQQGFYRSIVQIATTFINRLAGAWDNLTAPLGKVWDSLKNLTNAFGDLFRAVGLISEGQDGLDMFFDFLTWGLNNLATALSFVIDGIAWVVNGIKDAINWFTDLWEASVFLAKNMTRLFTPLGEIIQGIFTFDSGKIKGGISSFQDTWKQLQSEFLAGRVIERTGTAEAQDNSAYQTTKSTSGAGWGFNELGGAEEKAKKGKKEKGTSDIEVVGGSGSGRSVTVNIQNLINELKISGANMTDNIKEQVTKALVDAVNDFETSFR